MRSGATVVLLASLALGAFAANSILCRFALREGAIDPASFTVLRIAAGALILVPWLCRGWRQKSASGGWNAACLLAAYAVCFSWAYLGLSAGTGALLLFGSVQATIFGLSLLQKARPSAFDWLGLTLAFSGLVVLVFPGWRAPPPASATLMILAGAAWGGYTLLGREANDPVLATGHNFALGVPLALAAALPVAGSFHVTASGALLAVISGALTSGLGYVAWYGALRGLSRAMAGLVQLLVPILAAVAGILLLGEAASTRLLLAGVLVVGGISVATLGKRSEA